MSTPYVSNSYNQPIGLEYVSFIGDPGDHFHILTRATVTDMSLYASAVDASPLNSIRIPISNVDLSLWHTFRLEVTVNEARYFVDNQQVATITQGFESDMRVFLNSTSVGSHRTLEVDWVKVSLRSTVIQACAIDAPASVDENDPFTATVTCTEQASPVFGFEFAHSVDASSPVITPQTTDYNAGDIFAGKTDIFTLVNDLTGGFAQSLLAPESPVTITNSATLGGMTYDTDLPGTVTLNLDTLILGDQNGVQIPTNVGATTVVEIVDLPLAEVDGRIQRETGADTGAAITLTIDAVPPTTTTIQDGWMYYAYPEIVALDGLLEADAPGHLYCSQTLNLDDEVLNTLPDIVLFAGDVNDDDEVNIADGAIIVSARTGDSIPSDSTPDLNEDTEINILDLIHVGRNFGRQQPTACFVE
jgi:hypothetical protein